MDANRTSETRTYLLEFLIEESKQISAGIHERNNKSNHIKQWCLTLWLASWTVVSIEYIARQLQGYEYFVIIVPLVIPFMFFVMELINKRIERKFTFRSRQIHRFLNGTGLGSCSEFMKTGDSGEFRIYDPSGMNWFTEIQTPVDSERREFADWIDFRTIARHSWGLGVFYVALAIIPLIAACVIWSAT